MFFRREKPRPLTFDDRLSRLREFGFTVEPQGSGRALLSKHGCTAVVEDRGPESPRVLSSGVAIGNETGALVHGGYQQFFVTPSGKRLPALAEQLRTLHDFVEDLKEALGLTSFYNQSLGTTSNRHLYDRVKSRDTGGSPAPNW
jgi:hypothetical protein